MVSIYLVESIPLFFCLVLCLFFFRKLFGPDTLLRPFLLLVTSIHCSVRLSWQNPPCQSPSLSLPVVMSYKCSAFSHLNLSVCCPHLCSWRSPLRFTWSKPRLEVKHCSVITNRSKWSSAPSSYERPPKILQLLCKNVPLLIVRLPSLFIYCKITFMQKSWPKLPPYQDLWPVLASY